MKPLGKHKKWRVAAVGGLRKPCDFVIFQTQSTTLFHKDDTSPTFPLEGRKQLLVGVGLISCSELEKPLLDMVLFCTRTLGKKGTQESIHFYTK